VSETDSFIDEVTEEVRRDRLFTLMRRYGWIAILAVLLIVGGAAFNEWRKARDAAEAQAFGDAVLAAMDKDDRGAALGAIAADKGRAGVLGLLTAAEAVDRGDTAAARAALEAMAADASLPASLRALAELKAIMVAGAADGAGRDGPCRRSCRPRCRLGPSGRAGRAVPAAGDGTTGVDRDRRGPHRGRGSAAASDSGRGRVDAGLASTRD